MVDKEKQNEAIIEKEAVIGQQSDKITELEQQKKAKEEECQQQNEQIAKISDEHLKLKEIIVEKDALIDQLKSILSQLEQEKQLKEEECQQKSDKISQLGQENGQLQEQLNQLAEKQKQTEQSLEDLKQAQQSEKQKLEQELSEAKSLSLQSKEIPSAATLLEQEAQVYIEIINAALKDDPSLTSKLPLNPSQPLSLFPDLKDGVILCKFLNAMLPNTLDSRAINTIAPLDHEQPLQNL